MATPMHIQERHASEIDAVAGDFDGRVGTIPIEHLWHSMSVVVEMQIAKSMLPALAGFEQLCVKPGKLELVVLRGKHNDGRY
ncbi:MAG: hypothetical protein ACYDDO_13620 [Acidiferrobacterales bacterium]